MKKCFKCQQWKSLDDFHNSFSKYDGKQSACKTCKSKLGKEFFSREDVKEKRRKDQKAWVENNPELAKETYRKWRISNLDKAHAAAKNWKRNNPISTLAHSRKRIGSLKIATPSWADMDEIAKKYKLAKRLTELTGIRHSVDHYSPITSPIVCGLHCEMNMRVIVLDDNEKKHNKIIEFDKQGNIYVY